MGLLSLSSMEGLNFSAETGYPLVHLPKVDEESNPDH